MFLKFLIFLTFNLLILLNKANCENSDLDEIYLHLFGQVENVKRSLENLNNRLDIITNRSFANVIKNENSLKSPKTSRPIFDIRYDNMPQHCGTNTPPSTCAEALECTGNSGIYNIIDQHFSNRTFTVYCDNDNYDGDWLYILKRQDGSEYFNRSWNEYVEGFGNVAGEHWLGLEYLYALTNFYGPQELLVIIENFDGIKKFAHYDNFAIASAIEHYRLKSLGRYWGTAGDNLYYVMKSKFSTYDNDNDGSILNCAQTRNGGFWFQNCDFANPTGSYFRGSTSSKSDTLRWNDFGGHYYSHKTMIFMIRRRNAYKLE
ncbi:microfibril-associated glycoprotein 4-like [Lucilia cuprina]|uniref:microfibril-associated glycoprotein 4-like n=1 Tax=Lucilia cuprina TaxID=7375 RepID=UPI001F06DB8F|nr:microfibril-associated glycoprotein 4-like [Lucilia cuprina]